jgi:hypothetical protein
MDPPPLQDDLRGQQQQVEHLKQSALGVVQLLLGGHLMVQLITV